MNFQQRNEEDERLKSLALEAQTYPVSSSQRKQTLTRLLIEIQASGRLCRPRRGEFLPGIYEEIYAIALQRLWLDVCTYIDKYDSTRAPVIRWVNFLLETRWINQAIREVFGENQRIVQHLEENQLNLTPVESEQCLSELVLEYIESDPQQQFKNHCVRGHPSANFKSLVKRRLAGQSWEDISEELGLKIPTLSSFYQRAIQKFAVEIKQNVEN